MIEFYVATHHHKSRLFIKFTTNAAIDALLRDFTGSQWSHRGKCWHFEPTRTLAGLLYKQLKTFGPIDTRNLKEWFGSKQTLKDLEATRNIEAATVSALRSFEDCMRQQRYSTNTTKNYLSQLKVFF